MVLHVEVNYRIGDPDKYSWIENLLTNRLLPLYYNTLSSFKDEL